MRVQKRIRESEEITEKKAQRRSHSGNGRGGRIVVKRLPNSKNPLKILVGKKPYPRHVPIKELEQKIETK